MSYVNSSRNISLTNGGRTLRAECQNASGNWVWSELDLDTCIGNPNGLQTLPPIHSILGLLTSRSTLNNTDEHMILQTKLIR